MNEDDLEIEMLENVTSVFNDGIVTNDEVKLLVKTILVVVGMYVARHVLPYIVARFTGGSRATVDQQVAELQHDNNAFRDRLEILESKVFPDKQRPVVVLPEEKKEK